MLSTLDQLENQIQNSQKTFFRDLKIFVLIFLISALFSTIFTNAKLFIQNLSAIYKSNSQNTYTQESLSQIIVKQEEKQKTINQILDKYSNNQQNKIALNYQLNDILKQKEKNYFVNFSTLPSQSRLIINKIGMNIPIQMPNSFDGNFENWDYNKYLKSGVVKYPTTPFPGKKGHTLIFGHSSQEFWKHSKYGTIFSQLPQLQIGDIIRIVFNGKIYEYKVFHKEVVKPYQVVNYYHRFENYGKNILTLMACYPIGTDKKRLMVTAELQKIY